MRDFRFGFLCHHQSEPPAGEFLRGLTCQWVRQDIGEFIFWLHPETRLTGVGEHLLIGDAYTNSGRGVLDVLVDNDLASAIDDLGGRFVIITIRNGSASIVNDAFGSRTIFYRYGSSVFASHAALLAKAYGIRRDAGIAALMSMPEFKTRGVRYLPGDATVFEGIYALAPNNYLHNGKTARYWPANSKVTSTFDEFTSRFDKSVGALARPIHQW